MPAFIRTSKDEAMWDKAKQAANESRSESDGDVYWGLVNNIYHKMKKSDLSKTGIEAIIERVDLIKDLVKANPEVFLFKQELLDKTIETLNKAIGDNDEEDQGYDQQDYGDDPQSSDEDLEGMSETDPFEGEDDEASKWLKDKEQSKAGKEAQETPSSQEALDEDVETADEPAKKRSRYSEWKPREDYSPKQKEQIDQHIKNGYSEREAERLAGAHKGPYNFKDALNHTIRPSQPSPKMLGELKNLAGHWLEAYKRDEQKNADPRRNPDKFAAGKLHAAHKEAMGSFESAFNNFLGQDDVKGLKGLARHKAVTAFKKKWQEENPEHKDNMINQMAEAKQQIAEGKQAHQQDADERLQHMFVGGQQAETMSDEEAAQHIGGVKNDEGAFQASIAKDPLAGFAQQNPQLVEKLKAEHAARQAKIQSKLTPEQHASRQRVLSAKAMQGIDHKPPEQQEATKPKVIVRKKPGMPGQGEA